MFATTNGVGHTNRPLEGRSENAAGMIRVGVDDRARPQPFNYSDQ